MSLVSVTADLGKTSTRAPRKQSFWARLRDTIANARLRQAEREIAIYLELNGGRFTDSMERRILDRLTGSDRRGFGA